MTASTGRCLAVAVVLAGSTAFAQPAEVPPPEPTPGETAGPEATDAPGVAEARRRYAQGVVFFRAERYDQAIAEFTEAWALWENPTILYGLAQANERLLRVPRAIELYRRYLERAPDAANRQEVEDTIRGLTALLADLTVESNVPATVFANDEEIGQAPGTMQVATGRYDIELRAEGYETARQSLQIAARSQRTVSFTLRRETRSQIVVRERDKGLAPAWFWLGTGLTVAAASTATVLGVLTLSASDDFQADPLPSSDARADGQRLAIATDVMAGTAILLAAVTVVVLLNTRWDAGPERTAEGQP